MKIVLCKKPCGGYDILDGVSDILCHCKTLTESACVLEYLNLKPMSALEKSIARQAVFNWDNEVREVKERKKAKKTRLKEKKNPVPEDPETGKRTINPEKIEIPTLPEV